MPLCGACPFVGYCGFFSINYTYAKPMIGGSLRSSNHSTKCIARVAKSDRFGRRSTVRTPAHELHRRPKTYTPNYPLPRPKKDIYPLLPLTLYYPLYPLLPLTPKHPRRRPTAPIPPDGATRPAPALPDRPLIPPRPHPKPPPPDAQPHRAAPPHAVPRGTRRSIHSDRPCPPIPPPPPRKGPPRSNRATPPREAWGLPQSASFRRRPVQSHLFRGNTPAPPAATPGHHSRPLPPYPCLCSCSAG